MQTDLFTITQLHTEATLKKKWEKATHHTEKVRWHGLLLLKQAVAPETIVSMLDRKIRWLRRIVIQFNARGSVGVIDKRACNGGHNSLLDTTQSQKLYDTVISERAPDGGLWTGPKIAAWIAQETGKTVASSRGWKYTQKLGLSLVTQRPCHVDAATPQEQHTFKKNSRKNSPPSKPPIPRP